MHSVPSRLGRCALPLAMTLAACGPDSELPTEAAAAPASAAEANARVVCDRANQGALQRAIDQARPEDTILVSGTCHENVTIPEGADRITLDGGGEATISGPNATLNTIRVAARGVTIRRFTITGGRTGIDVLRGGTALIDRNTIERTGQNGINVGSWGAVNIVNNTIQNNPGHGIFLPGNSFAFIGFATAIDTRASPNIIRNNGIHGIYVTLSSSARIAGNTISDNMRNGVHVDRVSQANISDNTIDGNGHSGIFVTENSGVNLGTDTGAGIFDAPNRTTRNNFIRGISCRLGSYANGRLGALNGLFGAKDFDVNCIDSLDTPDDVRGT